MYYLFCVNVNDYNEKCKLEIKKDIQKKIYEKIKIKVKI